MKINFFPFLIVRKFSLRSEYLEKLTDDEILQYFYNELEKEEYKKIELKENRIEIQGDHSGIMFSFRTIWTYTQSIDYGELFIEHRNEKRKLVYKYQQTLYPLITFIFGLIALIITKEILIGALFFIIPFVLTLMMVYIIQIMTISGGIDKLEYREHWKEK